MESVTKAIRDLPLGEPIKANEALRIPDIVRVVFFNIGQDRPTLYRAIRLSKVWYEHGIDLLWENAPASALEHIATRFPARKKYYASKIVHFRVAKDDGKYQHPLFSSLGDAFTKLRSAKIEPYYCDDGSGSRSDILQYIQPTLEAIHVYGANLPENFLSRLAETSCKLREILLEAMKGAGYPTPEALSTLVGSTPSVERFIFAAGMEEYLSDMVWLSLARCQNVKVIQICKVIDNELLETIAQTAKDTDVVPFSSLREFDGQVHCTAITELMEIMPHLVKLELQIYGDEVSVIPHLPQLTHLRSLLIRLENIGIRPCDVPSLNKLTSLEELTLSSDQWNTDPECRELTDENFEKLVGKLSELRVLDLYFDGMAAYRALESVSKYCPKIEVLKLTRSYDLVRPNFPNRPGVMFPHLRMLEVGGFTSKEDGEKIPVCDTIRGLYTHLPKIETLRIHVRYDMFNFISSWEQRDESPYSSWSTRRRRRAVFETSGINM